MQSFCTAIAASVQTNYTLRYYENYHHKTKYSIYSKKSSLKHASLM